MRRIVTMEWRKLTTLYLVAVLVATALVLSMLVAAFYAWVVIQMPTTSPVDVTEATLLTTTRSTVTTIVASLVGVICVSGDRRSGGLALAVVVEPSRGRVLLAKATVCAMVGAGLGMLSLAADAVVSGAVMGSSALLADPWGWLGLLAGSAAVHAGWAVLGVATATVIRAAPAAVLSLVLGPWLVTRALAVLTLSGAGGHLLGLLAGLDPFAAGARLRSPLAVRTPVVLPDASSPGLVVAAATFAGFVAIAWILAVRVLASADLQHD